MSQSDAPNVGKTPPAQSPLLQALPVNQVLGASSGDSESASERLRKYYFNVGKIQVLKNKIHINKVISERFSISFFSQCADDIEINFCLDLSIYMDNSLLWCFGKVFFYFLFF